MESFEERIQALRNGEIEEIVVPNDAFMMFREAWLRQSDHDAIVGYAQKGGSVIYKYEPNHIENE